MTAPTTGVEYSLDGGTYREHQRHLIMCRQVTIVLTVYAAQLIIQHLYLGANTCKSYSSDTTGDTGSESYSTNGVPVVTGTIVVTAPTTGVEYSLDGGTYQASATFNNVPAGNHSVTVRSTTE